MGEWSRAGRRPEVHGSPIVRSRDRIIKLCRTYRPTSVWQKMHTMSRKTRRDVTQERNNANQASMSEHCSRQYNDIIAYTRLQTYRLLWDAATGPSGNGAISLYSYCLMQESCICTSSVNSQQWTSTSSATMIPNGRWHWYVESPTRTSPGRPTSHALTHTDTSLSGRLTEWR